MNTSKLINACTQFLYECCFKHIGNKGISRCVILYKSQQFPFSGTIQKNFQSCNLFVFATHFCICALTFNMDVGWKDSKLISENEEHNIFDQGFTEFSLHKLEHNIVSKRNFVVSRHVDRK